MRYFVSAGAIAALAFLGSTAAQAQVVVQQPAVVASPYVAPYATAPVVVAPTPGYVVPSTTYVAPAAPAYDYVYTPQPYVSQPYVAAPVVTTDGYVTVNSYTGRRCRINADGYRWCWTP